MTTQNEKRQRILREYKREHGTDTVVSLDVATWAVKRGFEPAPAPVDPMIRLSKEYSKAFREEHRRDPRTGRTYRANHAVTEVKDGKQITTWGDIDERPRWYMQKSFTQRREQIVGECVQLDLDCEHYNANNPHQEPVQMVMDFTDDVAERKFVPPDDSSGEPTHDA